MIREMDDRKEANGFAVGQRVRLKLGDGHFGEVLGFGPAWRDDTSTVYIRAENGGGEGNQGNGLHCCGSSWIEAVHVIEDQTAPVEPAFMRSQT